MGKSEGRNCRPKGKNCRPKLLAGVLATLLVVVLVGSLGGNLNKQLATQVVDDTDSTEADGTGDVIDDNGGDEIHCEVYKENEKECETCYDQDGNEVSRNCWEVGDSDDEIHCEVHKENGKECETCHDQDGNEVSRNCWEVDSGGGDCWEECNDEGCCKVCENADGTTTATYCYEARDDSDDWNSGTADPDEVERIKKEAEKKVKRQERELERAEKRLEKRVTKRLNRLIDRLEDEIERAERHGEPAALIKLFKEYKAYVESKLSGLDVLAANLATITAYFSEDKGVLENIVNSLGSSPTWGETQKAWSAMRVLDIYWGLKDAWESRFWTLERLDWIIDFKREAARVTFELGESITPDVQEQLDELLALADGCLGDDVDLDAVFDSVLAEADVVRAISLDDQEAVNEAVDDFWWEIEEMQYERELINDSCMDFEDEDGWWFLEELRQMAHMLRFTEDMLREIEFIEGDLEDAKGVVSAVEDLGIDQESVKEALKNLSELIEKAGDVLSEMKAFIESVVAGEKEGFEPWEFEEIMHEFWRMMDGIGMAAWGSIEPIGKYLDKNPGFWDMLPEHEREMLRDWMRHGFKGGGDPRGKIDEVYKYMDEGYKDELVRTIQAEVLEVVLRELPEEIASSVLAYLKESGVLQELLNNMDALGGDRATELVGNANEVYAVMGDANLGFALENKMKNTVIMSDVTDEMVATLEDLQVTEDAVTRGELEGHLEVLLDKSEHKSFEQKIQYEDLMIQDGHWAANSVYTLTTDGVVSGYSGEREGEFGIADNVTIAEAIKFVLKATGQGTMPQGMTQSDHWAVGAGFIKKAEQLGFGNWMKNLYAYDSPATREEVAAMICLARGDDMHGFYDNVFPDESGSQMGGCLQVLYDDGIFTGEGGTGNFNGNAYINRAGMAKVAKFTMDVEEAGAFVDEYLDEFDMDEILEKAKESEGNYPNEKPGGYQDDYSDDYSDYN